MWRKNPKTYNINCNAICDIAIHELTLPILLLFSCAPDWGTTGYIGLAYNWLLMVIGFSMPSMVVLVSNIGVIGISTRSVKKVIH